MRDACLRRAFGWLVWASRGLEPPHSVADVKRLCEFALVADLLQRRRRKMLRGLVAPTFARRLLTSCWSALGCGEILRTYVEGDRSGGLFVTAYPPFFRNGLRNAGLERALRRVLRTTEYRPVDFAILVAGAQRLLQGALGRPRAGYDRWPARWTRPCPTTREVYLLAHAVFYETDFGRTPHRLRRENRRALTCRLPDLFERFARVGQFDVVAELALVACSIGHPVPRAAWQVLEAAQRGDGRIRFTRRRHRDARDDHTTLAAIMAAVLNCGARARGGSAGTSDRKLQTLPARGRERRP